MNTSGILFIQTRLSSIAKVNYNFILTISDVKIATHIAFKQKWIKE